MLRTKWVTQWVVAVTCLILLSSCTPGINSSVSGHEQMVAETLFENHALIAITDGDFPSSAEIKNCLSEPVVIKVEVIEDKNAWILIEIPEGEWKGVDIAGNVRYQVTMKSAATDDEAYTEIGGFMGGGKMKIEPLDEWDLPFTLDTNDDWSCE